MRLPEADRAHDADLLPSLHDRACADDAERGDAHEEPEAHEALDQPVEGEAGGDGVVDDLLDRLRLQPAREERGLQAARPRSPGSTPGASAK